MYRRRKSDYDEYGPQSYTPSSNGYLVITKSSSGVSGIKTYLYDADSSSKTLTTSFTPTVGELKSISVTQPVKARYRVGELFDWTGAIVTAKYSDGHLENVTDDALFSPVNGTIATSDSPTQQVYTQVTVGYHGKYACFHVLTTGGYAIMSLRVDTPPNKTYYYPGEILDYTGITVTAVYWDGRTKDVTHLVTFDRPAGYSVDSYASRGDGNNYPVSISYEEVDERLYSNVRVIESNLVFDRVENNTVLNSPQHYDSTMHYDVVVEAISVAGEVNTFTVPTDTQAYAVDDFSYAEFGSNMSEKTYQALINKHWVLYYTAEGAWEEEVVDIQRTVSIWDGFETVNGQFGYTKSNQIQLFNPPPSDVPFEARMFNYTRSLDGVYRVSETFRPLVTLYYASRATYTINLSVFGLYDLTITPPTKTLYRKGEEFDITGFRAVATYTDGSTKDVTSLVTLSPDIRGRQMGGSYGYDDYDNDLSGYTVSVTYKETESPVVGLRTITKTFTALTTYFERTEVTPPTKSEYQLGDTLDYTGMKVMAVYKNMDSIDVTSSATITPPNGTALTKDVLTEKLEYIGYNANDSYYQVGDGKNISYTDLWGTKRTAALPITLPPHRKLTFPKKTLYKKGEALDYTGLKVEVDGVDVTSTLIFNPEEGTPVPSGYIYITITYQYVDFFGDSESSSFCVYVS